MCSTDLDERWVLFVHISQLQLRHVTNVRITVSRHCQHVRYTLHRPHTRKPFRLSKEEMFSLTSLVLIS